MPKHHASSGRALTWCSRVVASLRHGTWLSVFVPTAMPAGSGPRVCELSSSLLRTSAADPDISAMLLGKWHSEQTCNIKQLGILRSDPLLAHLQAHHDIDSRASRCK